MILHVTSLLQFELLRLNTHTHHSNAGPASSCMIET